jgi:hypothetical protein
MSDDPILAALARLESIFERIARSNHWIEQMLAEIAAKLAP